MARSFRRRHALPPIAELNVIPLIDLAFSMLIIFMIATPLIQSEKALPVDLPVSSEAGTRTPDQRFLNITIARGGYDVEGRTLGAGELESLLRSYAGSRNPPVIGIRADRTIQYQEVVTLLDLLKRNNLHRISLDTQAGR